MIPPEKRKPKIVNNSPAKATKQFRAGARPFSCSRRSEYLLAGRSGRRSLSPAQLAALQRFHQLVRYRKLRAGGFTMAKAARACGTTTTTIWRYEQRLAVGGIAALESRTYRCGRRSVTDGAGITPAMIDQVQLLSLAVGSAQRAWKLFAQLPVCPPRLARIIRRGKHIPPSLRKLTALELGNASLRRAGSRLMIQLEGGVRL